MTRKAHRPFLRPSRLWKAALLIASVCLVVHYWGVVNSGLVESTGIDGPSMGTRVHHWQRAERRRCSSNAFNVEQSNPIPLTGEKKSWADGNLYLLNNARENYDCEHICTHDDDLSLNAKDEKDARGLHQVLSELLLKYQPAGAGFLWAVGDSTIATMKSISERYQGAEVSPLTGFDSGMVLHHTYSSGGDVRWVLQDLAWDVEVAPQYSTLVQLSADPKKHRSFDRWQVLKRIEEFYDLHHPILSKNTWIRGRILPFPCSKGEVILMFLLLKLIKSGVMLLGKSQNAVSILANGFVYHWKYLGMTSSAFDRISGAASDEEWTECNDVLLNMLIANATKMGPVVIESPGLPPINSTWSDEAVQTRANCLSRYQKEVFQGVMPLKYAKSHFEPPKRILKKVYGVEYPEQVTPALKKLIFVDCLDSLAE
ncbi:hypothetical protein CcCBS67573_g01747 [Chytriomyces confervae]|uniref:Glycosyl transferase 64 domain-containing protein n=1 Tax=Chytriomyces confervae TaxID=246404 RepID=A0A507FMZ7_9FUNG|nr:hypothetical protein CcCBS67573_g01747 [Chytriomyces confervae]